MSSFTYTEEVQWNYNNEVPSYIYHLRNGVKHGKEQIWYHNGLQRSEISFHNGLLHGRARWWNRDGSIHRIYYYIYDKKVSEEEFKAYGGVP